MGWFAHEAAGLLDREQEVWPVPGQVQGDTHN